MTAAPQAIRRGRKFDQVLEGARAAFLRDGFEGASVDEIARNAGVSKATLYAYFPDKELLFLEIAKGECTRQAEEGAAAVDMNRPAAEVLAEAGRLIAGFLLTPFAQAVLRLSLAEGQRFPQVARDFYNSGPGLVREKLIAFLHLAVARGELEIDDIPLAAEQFRELCKADLHDRVVFRIDPGGPPDIERTVQGAVRMFMACYGTGVAAQPPA